MDSNTDVGLKRPSDLTKETSEGGLSVSLVLC